MKEASAAGLDPAAAWARTPGELAEYIEGYNTRMERTAYLLHDLATAVAAQVGRAFSGKALLQPWETFPGWIHYKMDIQTDDQIAETLRAWAGS